MRNKDGIYYKSSSKKSLRAAIVRFLRLLQHSKQTEEKSIIRRWEFNKKKFYSALLDTR